MQSCRKNISRLTTGQHRASHAGLVLDRYLPEPVVGDAGGDKPRVRHEQPGSITPSRAVGDAGGDKPRVRRALLDAAVEAARDAEAIRIYRLAFERWAKAVDSGTARSADLVTSGRLVIGMGGGSVIETALRFHHSYGFPVIPGSALKGLASHYCHQEWGQAGPGGEPADDNLPFRRDGEVHRFLFGSTEDGGVLTFHDAWIVPPLPNKGCLELDVMTPHHRDFADDPIGSPPTDFDSPNPIAFLSVVGSFHVVVSWSGPPNPESAQWTGLGLELLMDALGEWGAGGKTRAGYGRLGDAVVTAPGARKSIAPPSPPAPTKRAFGTPARVRLVGHREKGGFDVQEEGYPAGVLNLGTPRVQPSLGDLVDVFVKDDVPARPQYTWDGPAPKPKPGSGGRGHHPGNRR